jgi:Flp pilus assembly protein TadD
LAPWSPDPLHIRARVQLLQGNFHGAARTLRTALAKQPREWTLWVDLAAVTTGVERQRALAWARLLNPRGRSGGPTT